MVIVVVDDHCLILNKFKPNFGCKITNGIAQVWPSRHQYISSTVNEFDNFRYINTPTKFLKLIYFNNYFH